MTALRMSSMSQRRYILLAGVDELLTIIDHADLLFNRNNHF